MYTTGCVLLFVSVLEFTSSASIFLVSNVPSGSHSFWYGKLANLLAQRGHEVILLSTGPYRSKNQNVTFVEIENSFGWVKEVEETLEKIGLIGMVNALNTPSDNIHFTSEWSLNGCETFLKSEGTKTVINKYKNKRFDLIIIDFPCESFFGFVPFFGNPPFIIATPYNNAFNVFDSVGTYDNPSYVPYPFSQFQQEMTLAERALNLYYRIYGTYLWKTFNIPKEDTLSKEIFGSSTPHVADITRNASLLLVGIDPVLTPPKPLPPAYIPVGGFHIDKVKPLPQDIKKFLDEAKDGVIYFSFGSNFKSVFMTPEMIQMFLDVFREIPQRVVWKLEWNNRSGVPDNVLISKWLPQNDILAHPNVRCFISHGGLLSTQETIYHGVPVLGLPFMFDQLDLLKTLEDNGVGIRINFGKLTRKYIKENIQKIMIKSYRDKMQEWSRIFKDRPQTPEERAIWWIEYVLRNPSETHKYLRSASLQLYWYQRVYLDIAAIVLFSSLTVLYLVLFLIKVALRYFGYNSGKSRSKRKNKHE